MQSGKAGLWTLRRMGAGKTSRGQVGSGWGGARTKHFKASTPLITGAFSRSDFLCLHRSSNDRRGSRGAPILFTLLLLLSYPFSFHHPPPFPRTQYYTELHWYTMTRIQYVLSPLFSFGFLAFVLAVDPLYITFFPTGSSRSRVSSFPSLHKHCSSFSFCSANLSLTL